MIESPPRWRQTTCSRCMGRRQTRSFQAPGVQGTLAENMARQSGAGSFPQGGAVWKRRLRWLRVFSLS